MEHTPITLLLTGATGFVGQALCRRLAVSSRESSNFDAKNDSSKNDKKSPYETRVLLRDSAQAGRFAPESGLQPVIGDVTDAASLFAACNGVQVILHLAGIAHVNNGSPQLAQAVNVEGTRKLLEAALSNRVRRLVYVSSSLADIDLNPDRELTDYGKSKVEAENLLRAAHHRGAIEIVILRPVNVYGPGMGGNIAAMVSLISRHLLPPLPELQTRLSLVSVDDLCQALLLALARPSASGNTYTVTDGEDYRISEIEAAIYGALGRNLPRWHTPRMLLYAAAALSGLLTNLLRIKGGIGIRTYRNLTTDNVFSNKALCAELGFTPTTTLYQQLPAIVQQIASGNN